MEQQKTRRSGSEFVLAAKRSGIEFVCTSTPETSAAFADLVVGIRSCASDGAILRLVDAYRKTYGIDRAAIRRELLGIAGERVNVGPGGFVNAMTIHLASESLSEATRLLQPRRRSTRRLWSIQALALLLARRRFARFLREFDARCLAVASAARQCTSRLPADSPEA